MTYVQNTISFAHEVVTKIVTVVIGIGRAGTRLIDVLPRINHTLGSRLDLVLVDAEPGRSRDAAARLRSMGMQSQFLEAPIEDVRIVGTNSGDPQGIMVNLTDDPGVTPWLLRKYRGFSVITQIYTRMPNGTLYGQSATLRPEAETEREKLAAFFEAAQKVTARTGAEDLWGSLGLPEHRMAEPLYRNWQMRLLEGSLMRLATKRDLPGDPIQISIDGQTSVPMIIQDHRDRWRGDEEITAEIVDSACQPLIRGRGFAIGEIGPDGVRIHHARLRKLDGRVSLHGFSALDKAAIEDAVRRKELWSASRINPMFYSD